jgi:hypothetical protein
MKEGGLMEILSGEDCLFARFGQVEAISCSHRLCSRIEINTDVPIRNLREALGEHLIGWQ